MTALETNYNNSFSTVSGIDERESLGQDVHFLSRLLPYDPAVKAGDRLKDGLNEYLLLLVAAERTMESLQQGRLKDFDPLVGENACQIRAVKLALILSGCSLDSGRLLKEVARAKVKIEELLGSIPVLLKNNVSLKDLLENSDLDVQVSGDELFLIKSYLLSKVKVLKPMKMELPLVKNECTDTKKIKDLSNVGSMFTANLVRNLREKLAANSVAFVQEMARELPHTDASVGMVMEKYSIHYKGLQCLPCYWTARILLQQALINRIPIVVIAEQKAKDRNYDVVERMAIYFQPTEQGYRATTSCALEADKPALILLGSTCREFNDLPEKETWKEELLEYCPMEMILAYAATHRQYPDVNQEHLVSGVHDEEYQYYKRKAHEWGCSAENPSRFFLAHAFCDTIGNVEEHLIG